MRMSSATTIKRSEGEERLRERGAFFGNIHCTLSHILWGDRQWMSRLVGETNIGKTKVVGNLVGAFPEDDHAYWGYGVGVRRSFIIDELALGVEAVGDFLAGGEHELIGALHYEVSDKLTVKAGAGIRLNDASPDLTVRTGLTMKF